MVTALLDFGDVDKGAKLRDCDIRDPHCDSFLLGSRTELQFKELQHMRNLHVE